MAGAYANPGMTDANQWDLYHAEQAAKKTALLPPEKVGNLSLLGSQQVSGPGGTTSFQSQYGTPPPLAMPESASGLSHAHEGISNSELQNIKNATGAMQPTISRTAGPTAVQEAAARDAAFARAKDKSGQIAASSLRGLREALGSRGLLGGGAEGAATAELAGNTGAGLNDVVREQAIQEAGQASRNADTEYGGQIAQRGQNQASINALLSLINSRGKLY